MRIDSETILEEAADRLLAEHGFNPNGKPLGSGKPTAQERFENEMASNWQNLIASRGWHNLMEGRVI